MWWGRISTTYTITMLRNNFILMFPKLSSAQQGLTHWGGVRQYASLNQTIIGSENGLAPSRYLNQHWNIVNWTPGNKLQWNLNQNSCINIQENAFEIVVWKMAAILSEPQYVEMWCPCHLPQNTDLWGEMTARDLRSHRTCASSTLSWLDSFVWLDPKWTLGVNHYSWTAWGCFYKLNLTLGNGQFS